MQDEDIMTCFLALGIIEILAFLASCKNRRIQIISMRMRTFSTTFFLNTFLLRIISKYQSGCLRLRKALCIMLKWYWGLLVSFNYFLSFVAISIMCLCLDCRTSCRSSAEITAWLRTSIWRLHAESCPNGSFTIHIVKLLKGQDHRFLNKWKVFFVKRISSTI